MNAADARSTPLSRMAPETRSRLNWWPWLVTWLLLAAGYVDRLGWELVVAVSAVNAIVFLALVEGRVWEFPVQVRVAYVAWVALGTYVSGLEILMHITLVGLLANLTVGYCPLARLLHLLPWNRSEPFSLSLMWRTFVTPPAPGRFQPIPARAAPAA